MTERRALIWKVCKGAEGEEEDRSSLRGRWAGGMRRGCLLPEESILSNVLGTVQLEPP